MFGSLKEVKDTFFPNTSLEKLEGERTEEQIKEDLQRVIGIAKKNSEKKAPKKSPRRTSCGSTSLTIVKSF